MWLVTNISLKVKDAEGIFQVPKTLRQIQVGEISSIQLDLYPNKHVLYTQTNLHNMFLLMCIHVHTKKSDMHI